MTLAIVVMAYNRPSALSRLLTSLAAAEYPPQVRLIISIDAGGEYEREVREIADYFNWPFGEKEVRAHDSHLGLVAHFLSAGDQALQEEGIILLEDDLVVSPMFFHFAQQTANITGAQEQVGGISLNALWFNGYTKQPFVPYLDESDIFYLQVAWFQGMVFSAAQWGRFYDWRQEASWEISSTDGLHEVFSSFPETEWFPFMMKYLVQTNRTFLFPRQSLSTNFGDRGTHFSEPTPFFQVPLQTKRRRFRLQTLARSTAVYDAFHEILPDRLRRLAPGLAEFDFDVDLYGTKAPRHFSRQTVLSTKGSRRPLRQFGQQMWPHEANVVYEVPGTKIVLSAPADLDCSPRGIAAAVSRNGRYFRRQRSLPGRRRLKGWLIRLLLGLNSI